MNTEFATYLHDMGKSPKTVAGYCRDVEQYLCWCEETFGEHPTKLYRANVHEYLHHLFTGEWNSSGCLFMDCQNRPDFLDRHTIIYGHHMDNGSMFQNLMGYKDQSFYDEHPTAQLFTPDSTYTVEFFAEYVTSVDRAAWKLDFASDAEFGEWIENAKEKSLFESPVSSTTADKIVTLSTCSYEFYNARFVVHGVIRT